MKYVSTKRDILCRYGKENCIEVPYCALQSLLRYRMGFGQAESTTITMALILAGAKFAD